MNLEALSKHWHCMPPMLIKKALLVMRITAILTLACMHVAAAGHSQNVTINENNAPLDKIFRIIEKQTGYTFWYKIDLLKKANKVDISVNNSSLKEALDICMQGQNFSYAIFNKTIVVKRADELRGPTPILPDPPFVLVGTILDPQGRPMESVSIKNRKTGKTVTTNEVGKFIIEVSKGDQLEITSVGYSSEIYKVTDKPDMVLSMKVQIAELSDMVVVGYGSLKRKDLTGSVSSVNASEVKNVPFASIDQALSGKAAGVQVTQADGSPGGVAKIRIRGGTSLMGGNDPLYIIDGVQVQIQNRYVQNQAEVVNPVERYGSDDPNSTVSGSFSRGLNSLAGLNINDIESIDILKDASATAIYGSRAANGVVIITTKKGKQNQKPILEANYYAGLSDPIKEKLLNVDQYKMLMREAAVNINAARAEQGLPTLARADNVINNPDFLGTANTDWLGLVLRNGITQNADISVRGGGTASRYYTSLAYNTQQGVLEGTDFRRIAGKINLDNEITNKLRIITNLDYGFTRNNITNGIYSQALLAPPTLPAFNPDGSVYQFLSSSVGGYDYEGLQNPMALLAGINEAKTSLLLGSLAAEYDILKDLKFRSIVSVNYTNYHQLNYVPSNAVVASPSGVDPSNGGIGSQTQSEEVNMFYENTLTWDKQFNQDNRLNIVAGTSWQKNRFNSFSASGQGFPDDKFLNNLSSAAISLPPTGTSGQNSLLSFYMRANYALKEKYLFTFTGRSDASSKFPENNRVGYFPSGGVAWRISEEGFMKRASWLSELKLRASAGYTGTQNIGDNLFYTLYTPGSYGGTNAMIPTQLGNSKIKWETTLQKDLGLDFALFRSRLRGAIGYYEKDTRDMLLTVGVATSSSFSTVTSNLARIRNRGIEIDLRGELIRSGSFQWIAALNISGNRSKVMDINNDFTDPTIDPSIAQYYLGNSIVRNGEPIGLFYGKIFEGIAQTQKQVDDYKASFPYYIYFARYMGIGDPMYKLDSTGFPATDVIGNSQPKFFGGFTNTFTYKNFNLIALLTYSYGGEILYLSDIQNKAFTGATNKGVRILGRWTPGNPGSDRPRLLLGQNGYNYTASNDVYDGSYIKLKSITLTYALSNTLMKKAHMQQASIYVSATNLFTISNYPGPDPEVSNNPYSLINGSNDNGTYPTIRQFSAGVRIGF